MICRTNTFINEIDDPGDTVPSANTYILIVLTTSENAEAPK